MSTPRTPQAEPKPAQGGQKTAEKPAPAEPKEGGMVNEGEDTASRDGGETAPRGETF